MNEEEFNKKINEARMRIDNMDKIDGFKDRELLTILSAIKAGILNPKSNAQFDAYVMLKDLKNSLEETKNGN